MTSNPFTPSFGNKPEHFFGRSDVIDRFRRALDEPQSPDRVLFITGNRGCGKTVLLERLSQIGREANWLVIDVHSARANASISRALTISGGIEVTARPKASLPGGVEVSLQTDSLGAKGAESHDLTELLLARCSTLGVKHGVLITIDEIQKIPEDDMEEICAAVQMARRKGLPVMLYMAGLPLSKEKVASYSGCTFMQRVRDARISSLLIPETTEAFGNLLSLVPDITAGDDVIWALSAYSQGYPYLMQLAGYHFVEWVRQAYPVGQIATTVDDVKAVEHEVYEAYRADVLVPATKRLGEDARAYLTAMATLLDDQGIAQTGEVAAALGKQTRQLSACRQRLVDRRLITAEGYGRVRFALPHLSRFAMEQEPRPAEPPVDAWPTR